MKRGKTST